MEPDRSFSNTNSQAKEIDAGLRAHMQRVYNRMIAGVGVTAVTSFIVMSSPELLKLLMGGPQAYIFMFAPLALIWFGFRPEKMASSKLKATFFAISLMYGISLSLLGLVYAGADIARAFFIATGMFAGLSIFGYTTKKNLDGLMTFCVMGMFGVIFASLLNGFVFKSAGLLDMISVAGILVFSGITAWQTQSAKELYSPAHGDEMNSRMAWSAALNLYISFIALFQYILHFLGRE